MNDAFTIVLQALLVPLGWFTAMLFQSGSLPIYLAMFCIGVVLRLVVRPILGEAHKDVSADIRSAAKQNYNAIKNKPSKGG